MNAERLRQRRFCDDADPLGHRVAVYLSNEAEGWGAWANAARLFGLNFAALDVHADWVPYPHPERRQFIPKQRAPNHRG